MKERCKSKFGLPLVFLVLTLLFISANSTSAKQYTFSLSFGDYYSISSGKDIGEAGSIIWSFEGSNAYVGITVWIFDEYNFIKFHGGDLTAQGYEVSNGQYYGDADSWTPPKTDEWYIVFMHLDTDIFQITTVTADISFISGGLVAWVLVLIIVIPAVLCIGVIILIVVLVSRNKKKQQQYQQTYVVTTPIVQPQQPPLIQTNTSSVVFCPNCGSQNTIESSFCGKCGSRIS